MFDPDNDPGHKSYLEHIERQEADDAVLAQARRDVEAAERKALDLFEMWAQFSESQEPRIEWVEAREVLEIIVKARARLDELEV